MCLQIGGHFILVLQHLQNYVHQHQPTAGFWLVFNIFLYKKFSLNFNH